MKYLPLPILILLVIPLSSFAELADVQSAEYYNNLGVEYGKKGEIDEAIGYLNKRGGKRGQRPFN